METNENILPDPSGLKREILKKYPSKIAKKREKQLVIVNKDQEQTIQANVRTVPGIISQRGCTYAGCKGVVLGPSRDILNLVHGPIGCSFYAWLTRRNQTKPESLDSPNYMNYSLSSDMQDSNIVFGGEIKLKQAVREAYQVFKPKAIGIFATCPVGLIGDDIHAVAREMKEELGINIFGFSCEGYKGVSQSAGHHIANNGLFKHVVGANDKGPEGKFRINMLGEYNIGGDAFEIERLLEKIGVTMVASFSGNSTLYQFETAHTADLNLVMCHRSINYMAEMMETKYGVPWFKVNFIGVDATAKSLRKMGQYFGDQELIEKIEMVLSEEMPAVLKYQAEVRSRCEGKTAMLFVGGSRAHHYQELFKEIGVKTVAAGYEFAHRDDYEGRQVIPDIQIDADSRNIEELTVDADADRYNPRKTEAQLKELEAQGLAMKDYPGMMTDMAQRALVVDDINHYESEKLIEMYKPDVFCAG
ncbi:MAG: nitrogenase molybdenum-iron protein alpha chain, partial [Bacteroidetes bacterium]|nr:nitrogenase molybdenum-iron protein alpha chain [Bacteroidota bacterium]